MTTKEAGGLVAALKAAFPREQVGARTVQVYTSFLADLEYEAGLAAVRELIATTSRFPTIATIREAVAERVLALPSAEQAWLEVREGLRRFDDSDSSTWWPEWSHPAIDEAVRGLGGLASLELSRNPQTDRAHFLRIFDELRSRRVREAQTSTVALTAGERRELEAGAA